MSLCSFGYDVIQKSEMNQSQRERESERERVRERERERESEREGEREDHQGLSTKTARTPQMKSVWGIMNVSCMIKTLAN